jgi:hypothetical protein
VPENRVFPIEETRSFHHSIRAFRLVPYNSLEEKRDYPSRLYSRMIINGGRPFPVDDETLMRRYLRQQVRE